MQETLCCRQESNVTAELNSICIIDTIPAIFACYTVNDTDDRHCHWKIVYSSNTFLDLSALADSNLKIFKNEKVDISSYTSQLLNKRYLDKSYSTWCVDVVDMQLYQHNVAHSVAQHLTQRQSLCILEQNTFVIHKYERFGRLFGSMK